MPINNNCACLYFYHWNSLKGWQYLYQYKGQSETFDCFNNFIMLAVYFYLFFLWSALCNFPQTLAWLCTGWYISLSLRDLDDISLVTGLLLNCISLQWNRNIEAGQKEGSWLLNWLGCQATLNINKMSIWKQGEVSLASPL